MPVKRTPSPVPSTTCATATSQPGAAISTSPVIDSAPTSRSGPISWPAGSFSRSPSQTPASAKASTAGTQKSAVSPGAEIQPRRRAHRVALPDRHRHRDHGHHGDDAQELHQRQQAQIRPRLLAEQDRLEQPAGRAGIIGGGPVKAADPAQDHVVDRVRREHEHQDRRDRDQHFAAATPPRPG